MEQVNMDSKSLSEVAENYFSRLNPLAERISRDIKNIKVAYEDLWDTLSEDEKVQIINEAVIHPEVVLKYTLMKNDRPSFKNSIDDKLVGEKYILDEHSGRSYRDEHSTPFFWKTLSQLNLHIFSVIDSSLLPSEQSVCIKKVSKKMIIDKNIRNIQNNLKSGKNVTTNGHNIVINLSQTDKPDSPNVVLGGAAAVKTQKSKVVIKTEGKSLISFPNLTSNGHQNILTKLKASTVSKFQSGIKAVGGRNTAVSDIKKTCYDPCETENLVEKNKTCIAKLTKASPKHVSKPKSPPPPPPPLKMTETVKTENEKTLLLCDSPNKQIKTDDMVNFTKNILSKDLSLDADSSTSESFGLSSQSTKESGLNISDSNSCTDFIPKSGFDFLDNW